MNKFLLSMLLLTVFLIGCEEGQTTIEEDSSIEKIEVVDDAKTEITTKEVSTEVKPEPEPEDKQEDRIYFLTEEEKKYLIFVDSVMEIQTSTLQDVISLVSEANSDEELTKDENHLKAIEESYIQLEFTYSLMQDMAEENVTPKIFNDTHSYLSESVRLLLETESYFVSGLKELDKEIFDKGLLYIDESSIYFDKFNTEYENVMMVYK